MALPRTPDRITEIGFEFKTKVLEFEGGNEQRSARWSNVRRIWKLEFYLLTEAQKGNMVDYFVARKGSTSTFDFYDYTTGTTHTVRFKEDKITIEKVNASLSNLSFDVLEILVN